jgi:hypothetical protein
MIGRVVFVFITSRQSLGPFKLPFPLISPFALIQPALPILRSSACLSPLRLCLYPSQAWASVCLSLAMPLQVPNVERGRRDLPDAADPVAEAPASDTASTANGIQV